MKGVEQMTFETKEILQRCRIVFHVGDSPEELDKLCRKTVDLHDNYWTGNERQKVYRNLGSIIMEEVEKGGGVASVTYGHPIFCDDVHMGLARRCKRAGKTCIILPGISSLDTMCIDLNIDYGKPGLNLIECTDLVEEKYTLEPRLHTLLMQIGEYDVIQTSDTIDDWQSRYDRLDRYLLKFFPRGHKAIACYSDDGDGLIKVHLKIGNLKSATHRLFPGMTLYIPPVK